MNVMNRHKALSLVAALCFRVLEKGIYQTIKVLFKIHTGFSWTC